MKASERLQYIVDNEGLNAKIFSERIGFERPQSIYDVLKNKTKNITENLANRITNVYPKYSKAWLMTGEGDVLKSDSNNNQMTNEAETNSDKITTIDKALEEIAAQRRLTEQALQHIFKSQEQLDRLISLLERISRNNIIN